MSEGAGERDILKEGARRIAGPDGKGGPVVLFTQHKSTTGPNMTYRKQCIT